ncbi:MAG TPA: hypothetical protein VIO60_02555 [Rectinemataceae bacterium]
MRKVLAGFCFVALLAIPAFAADSFTTQVKATVDYTLTVTSTIGTQTVVDVTQTSATLGKLNLVSNLNGYSLTVSSANSGKMIRQGGTEQYPFTLSVTSSNTALGTSGTLVSAWNFSTGNWTFNATGAQPASEISFVINYQKAADFSPALPAGVYIDTLTFTIQSN